MKPGSSLLLKLRLVLLASLASCAVGESVALQPLPSPQRLLITVMRTDDAAEVRKLLEPDAADGAQVRRRATRHPRVQGQVIQVRVLEGEKALVHLGRTVTDMQLVGVEASPVPGRVVPYVRPVSREHGQGFHVQAELAGNDVVLNLYHYSEVQQSESTISGVNQEILTTVSGRVGQWLDAGGSLEISPGHDEPSAAVVTHSVSHADADAFRVLIKVELAKPKE